MLSRISKILSKENLSKEDILALLSVKSTRERNLIFNKATEIRNQFVGNNVYLRGLIEYSNICRKNCFYCGIRAGNPNVSRYSISEQDVLKCARYAYKNNYGSVVIQSGERTNKDFVNKISYLLKEIKKLSNGELGITLSCGEQSRETYQKWFDSGAHRYLLRFESADQNLYYKIHPEDDLHDFNNRMSALKDLREVGYQVGSGMMIGLPDQTIENLKDDLFLLKQLDVDMVGLGPYIEHTETPLYAEKNILISKEERLHLSLLTIAVLRIMMKDINIASATALDSLHPDGRIMAIKAGANVLMPNLTPAKYREYYFLYEDKPYLLEADALIEKFKAKGLISDAQINQQLWGDSKHYLGRRLAEKLP